MPVQIPVITIDVDSGLEETPTDEHVAPKFITPLKNKQVLENEKVVLEAVVDGSPKPNIRWEFEGKPLVENDCVLVENEDNMSRFVRPRHLYYANFSHGIDFKQFILELQKILALFV